MSEQQAKEILLQEYPELSKEVEQIEKDGDSLVKFLSVVESFY